MADEILVNPAELRLATGVEQQLTVGGQVTRRGVGEGFKANWFPPYGGVDINEAGKYIQNNSGVTQIVTSHLLSIPREQPFTLKAYGDSMSAGSLIGWGVADQIGRAWMAYLYNNGAGVRYDIIMQDAAPIFGAVGANFDGFTIVSDGNAITIYRVVGNVNNYLRTAYIPADVQFLNYRFHFNSAIKRISNIEGVVGQVTIQLTTANLSFTIDNATEIETRAIDLQHYGVRPLTNVNHLITLGYEGLPNKLVPVIVEPLYLRPVDRPANSYVIFGEVIDFESNGGDAGLFTASAGIIISNLKWQAPTASGAVDFSYTVGSVIATTRLNVVPRLEVAGVANLFYRNVLQGDTVQLFASVEGATFHSPNYPNLVHSDGTLIAPYDAEDEDFGSKTVQVDVTGGGQVYTFYVYIEPIFPTPMFCGASPEKWRMHVPKKLANKLTYDGGAREAKNRNRLGVITWEMNYRELKVEPDCVCVSDQSNFVCWEKLQTSKRLDAFYDLVGEVKKFTVIDHHTRQKFGGVVIEDYSDDHVLYATGQTRKLKMYLSLAPVIPLFPYDFEDDGLPIVEPPEEVVEYWWYQLDW
jgi:hypothetical protein